MGLLVFGVIKYLLICSNILFALLGLGLIAAGIAYYLDFICVIDAISKEFDAIKIAPVFSIVIGCIVFCIAFVGCWGAIRKNTCLLSAFAIILLSLFILQILIGVLTFWIIENSDKWQTKMEFEFKKLINHYNDTMHPSNVFVDRIQIEFTCCGATGSGDYENDKVPWSCCQKPKDTSSCILHKDGCVDKIFNILRRSSYVVAYVLIVACIVEIVSIIIAFCLIHSITEDKVHEEIGTGMHDSIQI